MILLNIIEIFRSLFFLTMIILGFDNNIETPPDTPILELSSQEFKAECTNKFSLSDLDNGGDLDAVFSNTRFINRRILFNDGLGVLKKGMEIKGDGVFQKPIIKDIDGDNDNDIFIPNYRDGKYELWINKGYK